MNRVAWIIFGAAIVLLLGGLVIYSRLSNPGLDVNTVNINSFVDANDQNGQIADHTIGTLESKVILVEYGDFQCPSCAGAHPNIKALAEEYQDRILFVFRNLPLTSIHPNARAAAGVAEAAGLQGQYWEMHDLLFQSQDEWSSLDSTKRTEAFTGYAQQLGLDTDLLLTDLAGERVKLKIAFDEALFKKGGYEKSTPTFILNGTPLESTVASGIVQGDTSQLKALLDAALAE